ncbi:hypothetical protein DIRU0_C28282 [Diutina rugosa]
MKSLKWYCCQDQLVFPDQRSERNDKCSYCKMFRNFHVHASSLRTFDALLFKDETMPIFGHTIINMTEFSHTPTNKQCSQLTRVLLEIN